MIIEKSNLVDKLKKLQGIASKSKTMSFYQGVLIENNTIMAANESFSVRLPLGENFGESFILTTDAMDLIYNLPAGTVELREGPGSTVLIKGGAVKAKFKSRHVSEFARFLTLTDEEPQRIEWTELKDKLSSILFACSTEAAKPIMTGIHFLSEDGTLHLTACDGYRLAWQQISFDGTIDCVVERDAISKLIALCSGKELSVFSTSGAIMFQSEDFEMSARLLNGAYPQIRTMVPDYKNTCLISPDAFASMVRRIKPLSGTAVFENSSEAIKVSCVSEAVDYAEDIAINTPLRSTLRIAFSSSYLSDVFNAFKLYEEAEIGFFEGESASLKPMTVKADSFRCMLLPIRVS